MKLITRAIFTLVFAGTLIVSAAAFAATPFDIATRAYRGQLEGIPGYQTLLQDLTSGKVTAKDIIVASGETPTPELESSIKSFLRAFNNNN